MFLPQIIKIRPLALGTAKIVGGILPLSHGVVEDCLLCDASRVHAAWTTIN